MIFFRKIRRGLSLHLATGWIALAIVLINASPSAMAAGMRTEPYSNYCMTKMMIKTPQNKYDGTGLEGNAKSQKDTGSTYCFHWSQLAPLPNTTGLAGAFIGLAGDALICAGGANFSDGGTPWNGGTKVWYDTIYALEKPSGTWKVAGRLPRPLGYGLTVNWKDQMILIGGSNSEGHYPSVQRLSYDKTSNERTIKIDTLPSLPSPIALTSGALVGDCIYVAGGQLQPSALTATNSCWRLDLGADQPAWEVLPSWPGENRMLSVCGAVNGKFYLFSGTALHEGKRTYLEDAYAYDPHKVSGKEKGWQRLQNLPSPTVAAPGPAPVINGQLLILGGDDGKLADEAAVLKELHPGFSDQILAYSSDKDQWRPAGRCWVKKKSDAAVNPNGSIWAPVTTGVVLWHGNIVLVGGEVRPGTRTPAVIMGTVKYK